MPATSKSSRGSKAVVNTTQELPATRDDPLLVQNRRRHRLRSGQRHRRPGARPLDRRRQDRRRTDRSGRAPRQNDRRRGPGRHARRHRHALPHRRAEGERRPQDAARGKTQSLRPSTARPHTHSGTMGSVPSTFATGYKYAGMGYTTAFDAAIPPLAARHAHEEFARHALHRQGLLRPGGQQPLHHAGHPPERARAAQGLPRLAAVGSQGLRAQAGQSRRRRSLEAAGLGQRHGARLAGRALRRHAAADHPRHRPGRRRAAAAAPDAHPLQQPRPAGQLDHHARNDEGPGGSRRAPHAHPVPQLRRRRRRREHVQLARSCRWPSTSTRTRTSRSTSARCCSAKRPA